MRPMIAGQDDASKRRSDLTISKQCAALLDPLRRGFKAFKSDAEFKRVGFSQGFRYCPWMERVLDSRDNLNDP